VYDTVVIGYRSWKMNPLTCGLDGPVSKIEWPPDQKLTAVCAPIHVQMKDPFPHLSPSENCMCGLYGFHDLPSALESYCQNKLAVIGVAAFWGRLSIHTAGFTAQHGRILAIADHTRSEAADEFERAAVLESVVERYGIPAIPVDLLTQYGLTFGDHIGTQFDDPE
jgi:hypothetical protein